MKTLITVLPLLSVEVRVSLAVVVVTTGSLSLAVIEELLVSLELTVLGITVVLLVLL